MKAFVLALVLAPPGVDPSQVAAPAGASDRDVPENAPADRDADPGAATRGGGPPVVTKATDAPVEVRGSVEPATSSIGDLLTLRVVAVYPRGFAVNLPTALDFSPLALVDVTVGEQESTGQGLRKTFEIRLQHFAVGPATVPSFPLTYVDGAGEVHTVDVPAVDFVVESLVVNENDPQRKGEDPPVSIEYPNDLVETIAWSALATIVAMLLLWLALRRFLRREKPIVLPPPIPAHEVALAALEELSRGDLLANARWADYYLQLTEIAKGYVEGRFGVPALDRTTDEIRRDLVRDPSKVAPLSTAEIVELLQRCDLVKFARFAPPKDDAERDLTEVRTMVDRSRPDRAPAPEAPQEANPS